MTNCSCVNITSIVQTHILDIQHCMLLPSAATLELRPAVQHYCSPELAHTQVVVHPPRCCVIPSKHATTAAQTHHMSMTPLVDVAGCCYNTPRARCTLTTIVVGLSRSCGSFQASVYCRRSIAPRLMPVPLCYLGNAGHGFCFCLLHVCGPCELSPHFPHDSFCAAAAPFTPVSQLRTRARAQSVTDRARALVRVYTQGRARSASF